MRKTTKGLAVLSFTAAITSSVSGLSFDAYAKTTGWVEENGVTSFYDTDGYKLTDTWKKKDNDWLYLNSDGELEFNARVDEYYVDENAKRVSNKWICVSSEEEADDSEGPETFWYYYGKDGKAATSKWISIDGSWYYFDSDSHMVTGKTEIEGSTYYFGDEDDGKMKSGWFKLENEEENPEDEFAWYYFDRNGKMVDNQVDKKIDGAYYTFVNGQMQTGWYKLPVTETDAVASDAENTVESISGYQYYEEETGKRANGWYQIPGAENISEEDEIFSFYFKNGKPYFAEKGIQAFSIDSKKYGFNTKGEMVTDLQVVTFEDGVTANCYFGTDGIMKTGKQVIFDDDLGETQTWFFYTDGSKKGQGFHGIRDNCIYEYGVRKEADSDLRYAPIAFEDQQYLVNTSGTIQKASASSKSSANPDLGAGYKDIKDANDKIWTVDVNGIVKNR